MFVSCEDEEEEIQFWSQVLIPALESAMPATIDPRRATTVGTDRYPWPSAGTVRVKRCDFALFLTALQSNVASAPRWSQLLTMCLKLGQKTSACEGEDLFDGTMGVSLSGFNLLGVHCMFWSTGITFHYPLSPEGGSEVQAALPKVGFWTTKFLSRITRSHRGRRRNSSLYHLMGTSDLSASQTVGHPPECTLANWESVQGVAEDNVVQFEMESHQFYSTFVYLFKRTCFACSPSSPDWQRSSSALLWMLDLIGAKKQDQRSPLRRFADWIDSLSRQGDHPLRFEPTFYLQFSPLQDERLREDALRQVFVRSAFLLGECMLDAVQSDPDNIQVTANLSTCLDRLQSLALLYERVAERIRTLAKVIKTFA